MFTTYPSIIESREGRRVVLGCFVPYYTWRSSLSPASARALRASGGGSCNFTEKAQSESGLFDLYQNFWIQYLSGRSMGLLRYDRRSVFSKVRNSSKHQKSNLAWISLELPMERSNRSRDRYSRGTARGTAPFFLVLFSLHLQKGISIPEKASQRVARTLKAVAYFRKSGFFGGL